jgi:hypothetical protein
MRQAVCDARAVRLARGLPLIVLAVVSLLFQDAAVQPQTIKLGAPPSAPEGVGPRRRAIRTPRAQK